MDWVEEEGLLMEQLELKQDELRQSKDEQETKKEAKEEERRRPKLSRSVPASPALGNRKARLKSVEERRDSIGHPASSYDALLDTDWGEGAAEAPPTTGGGGGKRKKPKKMLKAVASFAQNKPLRKSLLKRKGSGNGSRATLFGHTDGSFDSEEDEEDDSAEIEELAAAIAGALDSPAKAPLVGSQSVPSSPSARRGTHVHQLSERSLSNSKNLDEHAVSKTGFAQLLLSGRDIESQVRDNEIYQRWLCKWAVSPSLRSGAASAGLPMAALKCLVAMSFPEERVKGLQKTLRGAGLLDNLLAQARAGNLDLHRQLDIGKLVIGEKIYRGAGGIVKKATYDGEEVVVKISSKNEISFSLEEFRFEVALMSILNCPALMKCTGAILKGPNEYYMVIPYMERGSLEAVLKGKKRMSWKEKIRVAYRVAQGMKYLHYHNIIHRDLKSGNVLLDKSGHVRVTDFGMSRVMAGMMTQNAGTTAWTAPEVFVTGEYTQKADVYSFAVVLYEIFTERRPFEGHKAWDIPDLVVEGYRLPLPEPRELFPFDKEVAPDEMAMAKKALALIEQCWSASLDCRPDFGYICEEISSLRKLVKQQK